jgi:Na+/H+ antiporter NhaA
MGTVHRFCVIIIVITDLSSLLVNWLFYTQVLEICVKLLNEITHMSFNLVGAMNDIDASRSPITSITSQILSMFLMQPTCHASDAVTQVLFYCHDVIAGKQ